LFFWLHDFELGQGLFGLGFEVYSAGCEGLGVVSGVKLDNGVSEEAAKVREDSAEGHVLEK
jgi:hypothetical protein